jgi:DNA-directed RNA polymerase specialized sigma24 family protein
MEPSRRKSRWELNSEAFDSLLRRLSEDPDEASRQYEALRRRLTDLFAWERSETPEDLADEALNRLARRLSEGVTIEGGIGRYAFGIARLLLQEDARARRTREAALHELPLRLRPNEVSEALRLLYLCLDELPPSSRDLIERYYRDPRPTLARALGLSLNALRNRAMRVREALADCVSRRRDV